MMTTRKNLLQILESEPNQWVSGEKIANLLSVSRAAIWKSANNLRKEGYIIDAVRNKGYRLVSDADILSELGIWKYLEPQCSKLDLHVLPEVGSTNVLLQEKASSGCPEGTVLIAAMQTDGKGRAGRRFYSPADTGVYMSILLRPEGQDPMMAMKITTAAAVAACEAIESVSEKKPQIKWVNDVYLDHKKVCGILTEASVNLETGMFDFVVLGIGFNVYCPEAGFPKEIEDKAGYILERHENGNKNKLAAGFLNSFMKIYSENEFENYVQKYKERNMVIGKKAVIIRGTKTRNAEVIDIDDTCRLVVRFDNDDIEHLLAGEISLQI